MENKESFSYTYSAAEQEEIKKIRSKYVSKDLCEKEDKIAYLRRLDNNVVQKATMLSLIVGVIGTLILGFGMSLFMTDLDKLLGKFENAALPIGVVIGIVGIIFICAAYPIYNRTLIKERAKIAPEIIHITDELMK
ncbi:MAG: hypothetical protein E7385_04300 [Ruminococcaceae bacterium]|jgi:uncharacterized membrane protein YuzA (DUF378 family)|nr:hypothetical protein [Oscillospiraceae bacterium]